MGADLVIGSGPAGIAAAKARLALGRQVILLDGGKVLEDAAADRRDRLATTAPEAWDPADRAAYLATQSGAVPGQVRRFGSDFAMEPASETFADAGPVALRASRAVGGLSNLWGTAALPFAAADMADWPVQAANMKPHLRAVLGFMPVAGRRDGLAGLFPDGLATDAVEVAPTAQAAAILARLDRAAPRLARMGVTAGMARQAVALGCRACGLCLAGCPWRLMWSAAAALPEMLGNPAFSYRQGAAVLAVEETATGVTCLLADGSKIEAERLFLAAGVLETARILMRSGRAAALILREARHAFLPALLLRANPHPPDRMPLTTLPQLFVELSDPALSPFLIHAQLYGWNEQYAPDLAQSYGTRLPGSAALWPLLARRLVVAQMFLHSSHWPGISLTLAADGRLAAAEEGGGDAAQVLPRAAARMGKALRAGGLMALTPALRRAPLGGSFHVGASLPMAAAPTDTQSDRLGRQGGAGRMHVVDASVLPAIPATTITLPVMANAHRIASEAPA